MLPPLFFGNHRSSAETDLNRFRDSIGQFRSTITEMESTGPSKNYRHKISHLQIDDLALIATASTPVRLTSQDTDALFISVSLNGTASTSVNGQLHQWRGGEDAFFSAGERRSGGAGHISVLNIQPDAARMRHTASTMLGGSDAFSQTHDRSRPIALVTHGVNFDQMIRQFCTTIDSLNLNSTMLQHLGFDDVMYRMIAMMLAPALFLTNHTGISVNTENIRLNRVCEYIMANLFNTITLTDLEKVAQLSGRALQYAFMKNYGCSPMTWVRQQRLLKARVRLLSLEPRQNITKIALECGFTKLSAFSSQYQSFFNELPSETLQRVKL